MMCGVVPVATYYLCREFNVSDSFPQPLSYSWTTFSGNPSIFETDMGTDEIRSRRSTTRPITPPETTSCNLTTKRGMMHRSWKRYIWTLYNIGMQQIQSPDPLDHSPPFHLFQLPRFLALLPRRYLRLVLNHFLFLAALTRTVGRGRMVGKVILEL